MSHQGLLALTEEIYDAAAGGTPWTAVEGGLKALVRARTASLMVGDLAAGQVELLWREGFPTAPTNPAAKPDISNKIRNTSPPTNAPNTPMVVRLLTEKMAVGGSESSSRRRVSVSPAVSRNVPSSTSSGSIDRRASRWARS